MKAGPAQRGEKHGKHGKLQPRRQEKHAATCRVRVTVIVSRNPGGGNGDSRVDLVSTCAETEQQRIAERYRLELAVPRWMICRYTAPAIVMGRSQKPDPGQLARAADKQLPLVRRLSGGGAVMAGPEMLSLSVFLPSQHALARGSPVAAYEWLGQVWRDAVAQFDVSSRLCELHEARLSQQQARDAGADWACYSSVSHGELVSMDGRKLLGIAQIRNRFCTVLTSGMYLYPTDWVLLAEIVTGGLVQVDYLTEYNTSIFGLVGPRAEEVARALPAAITTSLRSQLAGTGLPRDD